MVRTAQDLPAQQTSAAAPAEMQPSDCAEALAKKRFDEDKRNRGEAFTTAREEFSLPDFYSRLSEDAELREKLHVSAEQERILRVIPRSFAIENEKVYNRLGYLLTACPTASWPSQAASILRMHEQEQVKAAHEKIEDILTPEQVAACKRQFLADMMGYGPKTLDSLGPRRSKKSESPSSWRNISADGMSGSRLTAHNCSPCSLQRSKRSCGH